MASETNVAQDQIKAYVDRILRMKEEADAIGADIKEIYAEAKANGFDKTQLGNLVTYLRKKDKDADKVAEGEAIFDLYLEAYMGASGKVGTKRATHAHAPEKPDPIAALRADPAMSIVSASEIKKPEPQSTKAAGSDLAPHAPTGQVADIPAAVENPRSTQADDVGGSGEAIQPETANDLQTAAGATTQADQPDARPEASPEISGKPEATLQVADKSAEAPASAAPAPMYADPGVITWESTPPEPVKRHDYSYAFGDLGQDMVVIGEDIASASAEPIVKIGNLILDGWARYMVARGAVGLDGQSTEYPVVQYDGADPLMDCIRWNLAGRIMNDAQKRLVAQRLAKLEPKRKDDIYAAMELGMELVQ